MSPIRDVHETTPCECCGEPVVHADVLAGPPGHVRRQQIPVDPAPLLPDPDLLLHLGVSTDTGRWLLVPLDDGAGQACRKAMPLPHAHRQHVCAVVPTAWLEQREQVPA